MISCTNHDEDSELLIKTTSESLKSVLDEYFPKYNYDLENTKIIFEKNSIEILPYIEQMVKKDYQWVCGVRYEILLNHIKREELTFGSVGVDTLKYGALRTSIIEWISYAGLPILDYFFNSDTYLNIGDYNIYPGFTGIRGNEPGDWLDGSDDMHFKLLQPIIKSINVKTTDLNSASLLIIKEQNKSVQGECRINGDISESTFDELKVLEWPDSSDYLLKQFYILSLKLSN